MGAMFEVVCKGCGYRAESSLGYDYGIEVAVETHICNYCKLLVDVLVDIEHMEIPRVKEYEDLYYKCPECKGENITLWDLKKMPCPKCGEKLEKGEGIILWD